MICPECRHNDHDRCYDVRHPHQVYRGCACQHQPPQGETCPIRDPDDPPDTPPG